MTEDADWMAKRQFQAVVRGDANHVMRNQQKTDNGAQRVDLCAHECQRWHLRRCFRHLLCLTCARWAVVSSLSESSFGVLLGVLCPVFMGRERPESVNFAAVGCRTSVAGFGARLGARLGLAVQVPGPAGDWIARTGGCRRWRLE